MHFVNKTLTMMSKIVQKWAKTIGKESNQKFTVITQVTSYGYLNQVLDHETEGSMRFERYYESGKKIGFSTCFVVGMRTEENVSQLIVSFLVLENTWMVSLPIEKVK